jgi:hypothetical protein
MSSLASGNTDKIDLSSLFMDLSPEEVAKLNKMDSNAWSTALGISPDQFAALGVGSAEGFTTALKAGLEEYSASQYIS